MWIKDAPPRMAVTLDIEHESRIRALEARHGDMIPDDNCTEANPVIVNGQRYDSALHASIATGISPPSIREACGGRRQKYRDKKTRNYVPFTAQWDDRGDA